MKVTAGLPYKHTFTLPGYSADDGWSLAGKLSAAGGSDDLAAGLFAGVGEDWTLSIPSETTGGYAAGDRVLYLIATKDALEEIAHESPATIEALGTLSHNRKMVTAIRALMEGRPAKAYETFTTPGGESITRLDPEKLVYWLNYYEKRLAGESQIAHGGGRVRTIQVGFK